MSDLDPRRQIERLVRVAEGATADDPRAATFMRGLVLGALVGAAIAGSTIWQRRRSRAADDADALALPAEAQAPSEIDYSA
jgi:hypothetical protein